MGGNRGDRRRNRRLKDVFNKGLSLNSLEIWHYLLNQEFLIRNASFRPILKVNFIMIVIPEISKKWSSKYCKLLSVKAVVSFVRLVCLMIM